MSSGWEKYDCDIAGRQLLSEGYLKEVAISGGFGASVELTSQAQKWMQKYQMGTAKELKLMPNNEVQREEKENVKVKPTFEAKYVCYVLYTYTGMILGLRPANERRRYFVTTSLIGWAQA